MIPMHSVGRLLATCSLLLSPAGHAAAGRAPILATEIVVPRPAQQAPAPQPGGHSTVTIAVITDDGAAVKSAGVTIVMAPAAIAGQATTPGGQAVAPGLPIPATGTSPPQTGVVMTPPAREGARAAAFQKQARTNAGGTAAFTELPAGTYIVSVAAPVGYVAASTSTRVQVGAGGQAKATVKLARGGVITGRIVDEDGDPVPLVWVQAVRATRAGRGQTFDTFPTNDQGVYRVWGLPAGDYYLTARCCTNRQPSVGDSGQVDDYLPTYYPSVIAFDSARPVQVRSAQETAGVDIGLVRGRLGSVTARVADSAGNAIGPNSNGRVEISPRTRNPAFHEPLTNPALEGRITEIRPDGTFQLAAVPAGDYFLSAIARPAAGAVQEGAYVPITVNGDDVNVVIQTNAGATISGRMVLEGVPPPQTNASGGNRQPAPRVLARSAAETRSMAFSTGESGPNAALVRSDGTFTLAGVRGPIQIAVSGGSAALKSVRRGATDISGTPLELQGTERIDDLVLVMTYDTGTVEGSVVDDDDEPIAGASMIVVPVDPERWSLGSPFVRTVAASDGGSAANAAAPAAMPGNASGPPVPGASGLRVAQLPAGRYLVIGVADGATLGTPTPQLIEQWRAEGTTVMVDPGQTATVKVRGVR